MVQPRLRFLRGDHDRVPEDLRVGLIDGERLATAPPGASHQQVVRRFFLTRVDAVSQERLRSGPVAFVGAGGGGGGGGGGGDPRARSLDLGFAAGSR
ncbi:MAG: hypothetical protein ACYTEZ_06955 [Planctomycetota bacterium]|jgi:hypothetical protein